MNKFTNSLFVFGALILMFLFIWSVYIVFTFVISQFEIFDARETAIVTVSSLVFLVSFLILATAIRSSIQKGDKRVQPQKADLYSRYSLIYDTLLSNSEEFEREVQDLNRHMMLWAADEVLKEYGRLLQLIEKGEKGVEAQAVNVLLEIRKDLGHKNRGVKFDVTEGDREPVP
jgi:hypothetical protein